MYVRRTRHNLYNMYMLSILGELRGKTLVKTMKNPERIVTNMGRRPMINTKTFFLFSTTNP